MRHRLFAKIVKESLKAIILASLISSVGGFGLQSVEQKIFTIVPLLILFPTLNNMVGGFGTVISSKFTSLLYEGRIRGKLSRSKPLRDMFRTVTMVVLISSLLVAGVVYLASYFMGSNPTSSTVVKLLIISVVSTSFIFLIISVIAVVGGIYIHKHQQDPDNFLIPLTTSIADLGTMVIFTLLVMVLF